MCDEWVPRVSKMRPNQTSFRKITVTSDFRSIFLNSQLISDAPAHHSVNIFQDVYYDENDTADSSPISLPFPPQNSRNPRRNSTHRIQLHTLPTQPILIQ